MCFRKKKVVEKINSKFALGDQVKFRDRDGFLTTGYVYSIRKEGDKIIYDVQIGGECPAIKKNIPEENLR